MPHGTGSRSNSNVFWIILFYYEELHTFTFSFISTKNSILSTSWACRYYAFRILYIIIYWLKDKQQGYSLFKIHPRIRPKPSSFSNSENSRSTITQCRWRSAIFTTQAWHPRMMNYTVLQAYIVKWWGKQEIEI